MLDRKTKKRRFSTDQLMIETYHSLLSDFRSIDGLENLCPGLEIGSGTGFREYNYPEIMQAPPYVFKRVHQLKNFLKRYIFAWEMERDLNVEADTKFVEVQRRVALPLDLSPTAKLVIEEARAMVTDILGSYDLEEHFQSCKFSTNATVGSPFAVSYLDMKLSDPLSGSCKQQEWFLTYLESDPLLQGIYKERYGDNFPGALFNDYCTSLRTTNVPKAWNKLRTITPNTTIGSFSSYGLGRMIQQRLKEAGLDLRYLQVNHQRYARLASSSLRWVTADLSQASDSFGADLIALLVPHDWYEALALGRVTMVEGSSFCCELSSFMAMGIGFTFPLQTLLFYCLLKAIAKLACVKGLISVFGDDLVYPKGIHKYVASLFPQMRLLLNMDKTFVVHAFRESCGGDYYRGIDVRPCLPEGQASKLAGVPYAATCYKLYNTLSRRWDPSEIEGTLRYLRTEILRSVGELYVVPLDMPDYSGIKSETPFLTLQGSAHPVWNSAKYRYGFKCLTHVAGNRLVKYERFYYWDTLRARSQGHEPNLYSEFTDTIRLVKTKPATYYKQWQNGKRVKVRVLVPVVDDRQRHRYLVGSGHTIEWTSRLP